MIIITGAAGFIASGLIALLNKKGHEALVLVDDFSRADIIAKDLDNPCFLSLEKLLSNFEKR